MSAQEHIGPLPPAFQARGWRKWGARSAVRLDGPPEAPFSATCHPNNGWNAYAEWTGQALRDPAPTLEEAIAQFELAESQGLFSALWRGQNGTAPCRPGWVHSVHSGRDRWIAVVDSPRIALCVDVLPAPARRGAAVTYYVSIDGEVLRHDKLDAMEWGVDWEAVTAFETPEQAMCAAEVEACSRAAASHRLTLLPQHAGAMSDEIDTTTLPL